MDLATILAKPEGTRTAQERAYLKANMAVTTWRPDTCGCQVHYAWDKNVPAEERVHIPVDSVTTHEGKKLGRTACVHHTTNAGAGKHLEHHDEIADENQRKNKVLKEVLDNADELAEDILQENGETVRRFKKGLEPSWSFDENRNLVVALPASIGAVRKGVLATKIAGKHQKMRIE